MGSLQQHASELHNTASVVDTKRQGALQMSLPHVGPHRGAIRLSHELTTSVYSLSIHAHRMLALALSKVIAQLHEQNLLHEEDMGHDPDAQLQRPLPPAIFTLEELRNIFGCKYGEVGRLAKIACADLMSTNITHYRSKDWRMCQWATFAERNGSQVRIDIHPLLRQYITSLNKLYTLYTLDDVAHFKTSAQFRLYELFKMNAHKTYISLSQQELKQFLAIDDHLYTDKSGKPVRKNFKMRIIDPSLDKINQHTDLDVSVQYSETPNGSGFAFKIDEKENRQRNSSDFFAAQPLLTDDENQIQQTVEDAAHLPIEQVQIETTEVRPAKTQVELIPDTHIQVDQIAFKGQYKLDHLNVSSKGKKWIEMMLPSVSNVAKALAHTRVTGMIKEFEDIGVSDSCIEIAINNAVEVATRKNNPITSLLFFDNFVKNEHSAMQLVGGIVQPEIKVEKDNSTSKPVTNTHGSPSSPPSVPSANGGESRRTKNSSRGVVAKKLEEDAKDSLRIIAECSAAEAELKRRHQEDHHNEQNLFETMEQPIEPKKSKTPSLLEYIQDVVDIDVPIGRTGSFASLMDSQE